MTTNTVQININAKDNASPVVKKVTVNLKEMGEKAAQVGMRMSAALTLPVVGMAAIIGKSPEVQAALKPISDEFAKMSNELALAFLPVIKQAVPAILQMAKAVEGVITWFAQLDIGTKNTIVTVGLIVAAIGPVIGIIGTMVSTVGLLIEILPVLGATMAGVTATMTAAAAPILAVAAALTALYALVNMTEFKQVLAMAEGGWAMILGGRAAGDKAFLASAKRQGLIGKANGGSVGAGMPYVVGERGAEVFVPGQSGSILPNGTRGGDNVVVNYTYAPAIGTGSPAEMEKSVRVMQQLIREANGNKAGR